MPEKRFDVWPCIGGYAVVDFRHKFGMIVSRPLPEARATILAEGKNASFEKKWREKELQNIKKREQAARKPIRLRPRT